MAYNSNYGFKYPKGDDFYNVEDFNGNFDKTADELDSIKNNKSDKNHTHNAKELTSGADLNDIDDEGYYWCSSSNTATAKNKPDDIRFFGLRVTKISGGVFSQELVAEGNKKFIRIYWSGGWTEWAKFITTKDMGKFCYVVGVYNSNENLKATADFVLLENGSNFSQLQEFINSIPSGSVVRMLEGIYVFTDKLALNNPIIIEGSGHSTEIRLSDNNSTAIVINDTETNISNVTLRNFSISNGDYKDDNAKLITMKNANGVYLYNLRIAYNEANYDSASNSSLITGAGYLRQIHIHDCVFNSDMESPDDGSYTIDFGDVSNLTEMCAFISGCSYRPTEEFCIKVPGNNYLQKLALYGFIGNYNVYDTNNELLKTVSNGTFN